MSQRAAIVSHPVVGTSASAQPTLDAPAAAPSGAPSASLPGVPYRTRTDLTTVLAALERLTAGFGAHVERAAAAADRALGTSPR